LKKPVISLARPEAAKTASGPGDALFSGRRSRIAPKYRER